MVQQVCDSRGFDVCVTNGWWERFSQRHPNVTLRSTAVLSYSRVKRASPEAINEYFNVLEEIMSEYNLYDKPGSIFNMDETGMPLDPKAYKVVVPIKG